MSETLITFTRLYASTKKVLRSMIADYKLSTVCCILYQRTLLQGRRSQLANHSRVGTETLVGMLVYSSGFIHLSILVPF